jgi:hypothetical protein
MSIEREPWEGPRILSSMGKEEIKDNGNKLNLKSMEV